MPGNHSAEKTPSTPHNHLTLEKAISLSIDISHNRSRLLSIADSLLPSHPAQLSISSAIKALESSLTELDSIVHHLSK